MKPLILLVGILLAACQPASIDPVLYGYVEGRLAHIAPVPSGQITHLYVREGDKIKTGQLLFEINSSRAVTALASARSAYEASSARLADLQKAGRPDEIRAAEQALVRLQATLVLAEESFRRSQVLVAKKLAPTARLDTDRAARDGAVAAVEEAKSRLALLKKPARTDQIIAARAEKQGLQALVTKAQIDLDDYRVTALAPAKVETVYRRMGELAGPAQPVLALLRPEQIRVRIFVPETRLQELSPGMKVSLSCNGCASNLSGKVTFISAQSEFTPPVIFTQRERIKLVWLVEVGPDNPEAFKLGQPVEVQW